MLLKTNVVSFDQHVPPGIRRMCNTTDGKMYTLNDDNSILKWDVNFAFAPVSISRIKTIMTFERSNYF